MKVFKFGGRLEGVSERFEERGFAATGLGKDTRDAPAAFLRVTPERGELAQVCFAAGQSGHAGSLCVAGGERMVQWLTRVTGVSPGTACPGRTCRPRGCPGA